MNRQKAPPTLTVSSCTRTPSLQPSQIFRGHSEDLRWLHDCANLYRQFGNQYGFSENWELINLKIQLYHTGHIPKVQSILPHGNLFNYVHCIFIHNNQKLETTQVSLNQIVDKKDAIITSWGIAHIKNKTKQTKRDKTLSFLPFI